MRKPLFPCELVVWRVLPAIRSRIATELAKKGVSQKEIAALLGITPSAVSQYISKKRGEEFLINKEMNAQIKESVGALLKNKDMMLFMLESCKLCKALRSQGMACKEHEKHARVPKGCEMCMPGGGCDEC